MVCYMWMYSVLCLYINYGIFERAWFHKKRIQIHCNAGWDAHQLFPGPSPETFDFLFVLAYGLEVFTFINEVNNWQPFDFPIDHNIMDKRETHK